MCVLFYYFDINENDGEFFYLCVFNNVFFLVVKFVNVDIGKLSLFDMLFFLFFFGGLVMYLLNILKFFIFK